MKTFSKALVAVAVTSVGSVVSAADFGPAPGAYYGNSPSTCPGGVCPPGNCVTGDCLAGGCATGNCNVPRNFDSYGIDPRYNAHRSLASQAAYTQPYYGGNVRPYSTARPVANCPGGVCPPANGGVAHTTGYRPQALIGNCANGQCPSPTVQRYPVQQVPRFSFLGMRF